MMMNDIENEEGEKLLMFNYMLSMNICVYKINNLLLMVTYFL